jgi:hypothetical protein
LLSALVIYPFPPLTSCFAAAEKRSKVFTLFLLAGAMGVYAYLQINVMVHFDFFFLFVFAC